MKKMERGIRISMYFEKNYGIKWEEFLLIDFSIKEGLALFSIISRHVY